MAIVILQEALDIVHVSKEDQESVFAMLAAVLWLGNISFMVIDNENHVEPVTDEGNNLVKGGLHQLHGFRSIYLRGCVIGM